MLIVVLWIVALLTLAVLSFGHATRTRVATVGMELEAARVRAAAQAGLSLGLAALLEERARPAPRREFRCRFDGEIAIRVAIADEAGKVNLNLAEAGLLSALLNGFGMEDEGARQAGDAIVAYRQPPGARGAGRPAAPDTVSGAARPRKGAPLDAIEEIDQAAALDPGLVNRLRPYLTVHSEIRGIDAAAASPRLLAALDRTSAEQDSALQPQLERRFATASPRSTFAISAQAQIGPRVAAAEEIVVRLSADRVRAHRVLAWRLIDTTDLDSAAAGTWPEC